MSFERMIVVPANACHARVRGVYWSPAVLVLCMGLVACEDMTGTPMTGPEAGAILSRDDARELMPGVQVILSSLNQLMIQFTAPVLQPSTSTMHSASLMSTTTESCKTYDPRVPTDDDRDGYPVDRTIT